MQNKTQLARFVRVNESSPADWPGMDYAQILQLQRNNTPVQVLGVGCEVDGQWEHDYHNVQLPDGTILEAISGYNLQRL